jgi:hypothetical protein
LDNDILLRDIDYLLHDVHLAADAVDIRNDEIEAGLERAGVFAETLDRPLVALRNRLDGRDQRQNGERNEDDGENIEAEKHERFPLCCAD